MHKLLSIFTGLVLSCWAVQAQTDSSATARMDAMLNDYVAAMQYEPEATKSNECDFLISSCTDSLLRQRVALRLYGHYLDSQLMGDESVAIHIYDRWFADGTVAMLSDIDRLNASIFAEYNRSSLVGMQAPVIELRDEGMAPFAVPAKNGRQSVIYFYDVDCSKCKLESIVLRYCLQEQQMPLDFYAVYVGSDAAAWKKYREEQLNFSSTNVRTYHLWDPEVESEYHRYYGVLQTPRLFLIGASGMILGRRLTVDALDQLLQAGAVENALMSRNPVGARLPSIVLPGVMRTHKGDRDKKLDIRKLKGRPAHIVFYSEGCSNCQKELAALEGTVTRGQRVFLVNVDGIIAENPELAKSLFDNFDLTVLPHIISLDSKGTITDRYVSFVR